MVVSSGLLSCSAIQAQLTRLPICGPPLQHCNTAIHDVHVSKYSKDKTKDSWQCLHVKREIGLCARCGARQYGRDKYMACRLKQSDLLIVCLGLACASQGAAVLLALGDEAHRLGLNLLVACAVHLGAVALVHPVVKHRRCFYLLSSMCKCCCSEEQQDDG